MVFSLRLRCRKSRIKRRLWSGDDEEKISEQTKLHLSSHLDLRGGYKALIPRRSEQRNYGIPQGCAKSTNRLQSFDPRYIYYMQEVK